MIVGVDPGFADLGIVVASKPRQIDDVVFMRCGVVETRKDREVSNVLDIMLRSMHLADGIVDFVEQGPREDVDFLCVEGFSRPPNVGTAVKLGAANGVVGSLAARWDPGIVVLSPQDIRKAVLDVKKTPSEAEVHSYLLERYPELADLLPKKKAHRPHILDAAAAVVAAYKLGAIS